MYPMLLVSYTLSQLMLPSHKGLFFLLPTPDSQQGAQPVHGQLVPLAKVIDSDRKQILFQVNPMYGCSSESRTRMRNNSCCLAEASSKKSLM